MPDLSDKIWAECGSEEMRRRDKESDNIHGLFTIPKHARRTFEINSENQIRVLVRHDGTEVETIRPIHSNGRKFTLPADKREELDLKPGDEPEFWIRPASESTSEVSDDEVTTQVDLSEVVDSEEDIGYVLLVNSSGKTLHATKNNDETACGKDVDSAQTYVSVGSPDSVGGSFSECQRCAQYATGIQSQPECRQFLSERIDAIEYSDDDSTPGYLNKNEMPALVSYIEELEEQATEAR